MEKLFGIPMDTIMVVLLAAMFGVSALVGITALRNRVMLKLGLRNIPRRRSQTILIVIGLTLATIIITSAFGTGDTITYSIRSAAVDQLGQIDETLRVAQNADGASSDIRGVQYFPIGEFSRLRDSLRGYEAIDGLTPAIVESAPLVDVTSQQNKSRVSVFGLLPDGDSLFVPAGPDGQRVDLGSLAANEVYVTDEAAKDLNASPGDELHLFVSQQPTVLILKGTVRKTGLPGPGMAAAVVMPLNRAQSLFGKEGQINRILVSNRGGPHEGAELSAQVTKKLRSLLADDAAVSEIVRVLSTPAVRSGLVALRDRLNDEPRDKITSLLSEIDKGQVTDDIKSLLGDDAVAAQLKVIAKDLPDQDTGGRLGDLLTGLSKMAVEDTKAKSIDQAEQVGSAFTTIFVSFGLFSIAAGVLLIFLIFVMLAAERKPEMGMARAVGTKRRHLIEMFAFEGYAYDLVAAAVGVVAGIAVGYVMVGVIASAMGQADFEIRRHFEVRSLVVSYCLGMLLTFITVTISAWRVSRINIVSAIRNLPDVQGSHSGLLSDLAAPFRVWGSVFRNLFRLRIRRLAGDLLVRGPRATWTFWWALFRAGPLTTLVGVLLIASGIQTLQAFPFSLGMSLAIMGFGLVVRWALAPFGLRNEVKDRIGYSLAGILIVVYWSLPFETLKGIGVPELKSGIEMFFLSGMMMVLGAVLAVIYNSDVIIALLTATLGRLGQLTPVVKTAVAYPMSSKFRTGLTLAMFSLVVFTMIVMSVIINGMTNIFADREAMSGGYQVRGTVSYSNPVKSMGTAIVSSSNLNAGDFDAVGGVAALGVQVRQPDGGSPSWERYSIGFADDGFLDSAGFKFSTKATGYETDRDIWRALKDNPGFAVVDAMAVPQRTGTNVVIGGPTFKLSGVYLEDKTMDPIEVEVRDQYAGRVAKLTIIGVMDGRSFLGYGLFTSMATVNKELSFDLPATAYFFKLAPGTDAVATARALGTAFLQNGMEAKAISDEIDKSFSSNLAMNNLMQGFMSLGLLVGIAALGVISTRSVVERRQQIGMLRAIGYKQGMVQLSFLMESSFVALLGILLGVGLGMILSYNLMAYMAKTVEGLEFDAPWGQVLLIVGIAYGASLLTTYLPARQAARVYPAEALRYE